MARLGLTGPEELTLAHQKFQMYNLGPEATKITYQNKVVMKASKSTKSTTERSVSIQWRRCKDTLSPLSEQVNREWQGALLSCPQR